METKFCSKCKKEKPLTEEFFYKHSTCKTGFHTLCIECCKENGKLNRKDPEKRETARVRASNHWHSKKQEERSEICFERRLQQRFKRTPEWYEKTLEEQGGHCFLCEFIPEGRRLHVDHDHTCCPCEGTRYTCGKCIRGLLCSECNTRLGYLELVLRDAQVFPHVRSWTAKAMKYLLFWRSMHRGPDARPTQETQ